MAFATSVAGIICFGFINLAARGILLFDGVAEQTNHYDEHVYKLIS